MSPFLIIWFLAFCTLIGLLLFARLRINSMSGVASAKIPRDFSEFISWEFHDMLGYALRVLSRARPHGKRILVHALSLSRRGHELFIQHIFGRMEIKKGKAISFFLKHISEYKTSEERDEESTPTGHK